MTARRFTDSLEPDPRSPRRMSEIAGDQESSPVSMFGPAAPILPSTKAPPTQRQNGPRSSRIAFKMKFPTIPLLPQIQNPPWD